MNDARRARIRELVQMLESAGVQVQALLIEEEIAFEGRSGAARETESANISEEAVRCLSEAAEGIEHAVQHMQIAVGDDSLDLPRPPSGASNFRRRF